MFVIMSCDRKCIVKGKTRKVLCGVEEPTRKQLLAYDTEQKAKSALMRMYLLNGSYAQCLYGSARPGLEIVETDQNGYC